MAFVDVEMEINGIVICKVNLFFVQVVFSVPEVQIVKKLCKVFVLLNAEADCKRDFTPI